MAVSRVNRREVAPAKSRPAQFEHAGNGVDTESVPGVLWLLVLIVPLLVGCTVLVPVNGNAALTCGAAAGAVVIAWPWFRLYRAMREHERAYPEERQRPWWQRWPWGSPPVPQPQTVVDRFFAGLGIVGGIGLGLLVLACLSGLF
ncbi:MAG: hypothetical protein JW900_04905 [Anaerolineae bacterium]|nr:hypothetical protein [Anaerolineae bacterium]